MVFAFRALEAGYPVPMREVGANIPYEWLIYLFMLVPLGFLACGAIRRIKIWQAARGSIHRSDRAGARVASLLVNTFAQKKVIKKPLAGWMHFLLFWGFVVLFIATASFASWDKTGFPPLTGDIYVYFSLVVDVMGCLAMVGVAVLAFIRYVQRPDRLNDTRPLDGWLLLLIFVILLTGYVIEGLRIAGQIKLSPTMAQIMYERTASPVGWLFSAAFSGQSLSSILLWHRITWWSHMAIAFLFIGALPFTKLWHIITGMIGYYSRDLEPGTVRMVDNLEEAETFGVEHIEDFGWKDLLDLDACMRCGRCQEACPAYNTGKALNPKITVIQAMKKHLDHQAPALLAARKEPEPVAMTEEAAGDTGHHLIYDVVTTQVLWDCTNCAGCVVHCPVGIEHIAKIVEMRRNLVMWQGDIPVQAKNTFVNLERNYNPWGVGWALRAQWLTERGVRDKVQLLPDGEGPFDYLFFAGCAVAFDDRYKKAGEALVRLLDAVGLKTGYLGTEEVCCGDSARRLGNEYLFQSLASQNIEAFTKYGVQKIITICPHGYNTIKNEYPKLGGEFEVFHASEILAQLVGDKRIRLDRMGMRVSYHDSCFLGRHNGIYRAPREAIRATGATIMEIPKSEQFGFCCGAGGGRMWFEEERITGFERINETRTNQLLEPSPEFIITNCPFCLTMISDGVKQKVPDDSVQVLDLCELLWRATSQG